ncbi:AlpA family phage regulatory protein [Rhizobium ruizarguesonis]|uniref:helix-turn-helix transcriptional regulator n=1 Tax=Rhizobium ruizarguesonis TaxID=2081791 RepID=UPI00103025DB|nr:AlpA family phage regulatory protein [Rhizobium ruizarguesonis]TBB97174.1 AlpA family phage regulatory protein [Rhizobium ruizarguesonis]
MTTTDDEDNEPGPKKGKSKPASSPRQEERSRDEENVPGFYSRRQVSELTTLSRTTIWRWVANELFPKPVKLVHKKTAWWRPDVHRWMEEQRK